VSGRKRANPAPATIRLLISDIDGTLVTPDKVVTPAAHAAVKALATAGIGFSVVSARPPRGMSAVTETLGLTLPFAAFNGGSLVTADRRLISALRLPAETARTILTRLDAAGVAAWVFADDRWLLTDPDGPEVPRERHAVGFDATVVTGFADVMERIDKIVGVSDDPKALGAVETEAATWLEGRALAQRSQAYYLDFTAPKANKGHAVRAICAQVGVSEDQTAVIGDMTNDVAMFEVAGLAIAMGQSSDTVKAQADFVTDANTADGFARAVERFVLPRKPARS